MFLLNDLIKTTNPCYNQISFFVLIKSAQDLAGGDWAFTDRMIYIIMGVSGCGKYGVFISHWNASDTFCNFKNN